MIIDKKPPLTGVYLAHFGVRGMKWGQRKKRGTLSAKERVDKIGKLERKLDRINGYRALQGDLNRSWGEKRSKANRREFGKVDQKKFGKMTLDEKRRFESRGAAVSRAHILARGSLAVGAIVGGGLLLTNRLSSSASQIASGRRAVGAIGAVMGMKIASDLRDVSVAQRREDYRYQIAELEGKKY